MPPLEIGPTSTHNECDFERYTQTTDVRVDMVRDGVKNETIFLIRVLALRVSPTRPYA